MSTVFKDISIVDPVHSHIDSSRGTLGHPVGKTTFRLGLEFQGCGGSKMQLRNSNDLESMSDQSSRTSVFGRTISLQNRLNQDLRTIDHSSSSTASRTFGLQSRKPPSVLSLHPEDDIRLSRNFDGVNQRNKISTVSKTFGLIPDDINGIAAQNNGKYYQELRRNESFNSSAISRPFGLHTRTLTSQFDGFSQDHLRVNQDSRMMNFRSTRTGLEAENLHGLISYENETFNQDLKRNTSAKSSVLKRFGSQSRNLTSNQDVGLRLNHDLTLRSNNISAISRSLGPAVQDATALHLQENLRYNDDIIDNIGFRRPLLTRDIRGRSSISTSRLFQNQNTKLHCKDLSNINGFNVSHISQRDAEMQSDSRLPFSGRSNWKDNQSMSGSVLSVTSMKSQFMNLLENLHHSILNISPQITAEAVRLEFDRVKQRLEDISEMSFAPSVSENCGMSVISHSNKYLGHTIIEPPSSKCSYGNPLKSSKEILKTLMSSKESFRDKFKLATHHEVEEEERRKSSLHHKKSNGDESLFKKPRPFIRNNQKKRSLRKMPEVVKSPKSPSSNKMIKLKQWYPIAVGSDLALCGIDEEGEVIKTDAVKKRMTNRKVELINGSRCSLIGSPSTMVSVLPKKIINLLKNGLTDRWRVLQKELLNCQTAEEEIKKRVSKTPEVRRSPLKKMKTPPRRKTKTGKVTSTPKKKINEVHTRSGRMVKPPSMFWIATGGSEVTSTVERIDHKISSKEDSPKKKIVTTLSTPMKKLKETPHKSPIKTQKKGVKSSPKKKPVTKNTSPQKLLKKRNENVNVKVKASPGKSKKMDDSLKKSNKRKSPEKNKKKLRKEELKVGDTKKESKGRKEERKRKREVNGDAEFVQSKKSKLEKKSGTEVESTTEACQTTLKSGKEKNDTLKLSIGSLKTKGKKSPVKKKKETVKRKTKNTSEVKTDAKETNEFEEDFELKLDDIEIPEIANMSGNPQLSRSQLRLISMETPPLKYFNNHLNLLRSATPVRSPSWCISQRTESEVKQFQKRREEALKKKMKVNIKKAVMTEKSKNTQNRDVKKVIEWVAEKTIRSPQWSSKILQYVIPSRKMLEERMNDEEDEDVETEFI